MKVEVKKLDKLKRVLKVCVDGEEFLKDRQEFCAAAAKRLSVPGFRKGCAPVDVVQKHHDKLLKEQFVQDKISDYYARALRENDIPAAGMPRIYDVEITDSSFNFSADVETHPEIDIAESVYKGIKIKEKIQQPSEKEIDKVLDSLEDGLKKAVRGDYSRESLAKWSGYSDIASLREAIKVELAAEKLRQRRVNIDSFIASHLIKSVKIDLPQSEVDNYQKQLTQRQLNDLRARGVSDSDLEKYKKDLEEKAKKRAADEVKLFYILGAIARKENIKPEDNNNFSQLVLGFILSRANYE